MRFLCGILVVLGGCGGGGESSLPAPQGPAQVARPVDLSDLQVANLLYSDRQRTPEGFALDPAPPGYGQVTTFHLAACTDDWNTALAASEAAALAAPTYSDLVATVEEARYFEFGRVPRTAGNDYLRMRVYRCAWYDPAAPRINARPLDAATVSAFAEYQWQYTSFNNFGQVVLERATRTTATAIEHTLDMAVLAGGAGGAGCDRIDVLAWTYGVAVADGAVSQDTQPLYSFSARFRDGAAALCEASPGP